MKRIKMIYQQMGNNKISGFCKNKIIDWYIGNRTPHE